MALHLRLPLRDQAAIGSVPHPLRPEGRRVVLALDDTDRIVVEIEGQPPHVLTGHELAVLRVAMMEMAPPSATA